jgi:hypothetical protein
MLMKKKIFFGFIFAFLILFSASVKSYAACAPDTSGVGQCPRSLVHCSLSDGSVQCCDQAGGGCSQLPGSVQQTAPPSGVTSGPGSERCSDGINTAIGCIPVLASDNGVTFMGWLLRWAVGLGSGVAFILILYGGFLVMTSQGNPERVKAGQELITSAVSGIILLVLSIFLLKFIGVDILGLNAWGFS